MRNKLGLLLIVMTLCGCRGNVSENSSVNQSAGVPARTAVQTATLTGLYEGGEGPRRNQICMIEREGATTFGLVTWSSGDANCSGYGRAVREGDRLRLTMDGDQSCAIEARLEGRRVALPDQLPQGCGYYCGPNARLAGATFEKVGGAEPDAMRAVDLVGDPLCGR